MGIQGPLHIPGICSVRLQCSPITHPSPSQAACQGLHSDGREPPRAGQIENDPDPALGSVLAPRAGAGRGTSLRQKVADRYKLTPSL